MLVWEHYKNQRERWPSDGRHILAQYDADRVVVYQAYRPEIGDWAVKHQSFGGPWSVDRMSWVKPNFLWMMYRSGWGTKVDQEVTLAISLRRSAFEEILALAVHSSFVPEAYHSQDEWRRRVAESDVRLQWDPDHGPTGASLNRRAIQLGMRGQTLAKYAREWILQIEDVSEMVQAQRANVSRQSEQLTPRERVFDVRDKQVRWHLGIDDWLE